MERDNPKKSRQIEPLENLFVFLDMLPATYGDSLDAWKNAVTIAADEIHNRLDSEIERINQERGQLSLACSLVTVLALLVSEELDAGLKALIEDDWSGIEPLYKQYTSQWALTIAAIEKNPDLQDELNACGKRDFLTWEEWRQYHLSDQFILFRGACERLKWEEARVPVKRFTPHENHSGRILLSIDPYSGINTVLESVEKYLQSWRDELHQQIEIDWANELSQGVIDTDFIQKEIIEANVSLGDKESFKGKKQARKTHTTLEIWQHALRVFDMVRRGYHRKKITEQPWWKGRSDENASRYTIPENKKLAKKLIAHAWSGSLLINSNIRISYPPTY